MAQSTEINAWLVYWKVFWEEWERYGPGIYREIYHTRSEWFYKAVRPGAEVWLIVSGGKGEPGLWRLALRFTVRRKSYGRRKGRPYRFLPQLEECDLYCLDGQPDLTYVLRKLRFIGGRRIVASGRLIGRSLQTPRRLTEKDLAILRKRALALRRF